MYKALGNLQQRRILLTDSTVSTTHVVQLLVCSQSYAHRRCHHDETCMYEFIMRLCPEFKSTQTQLLHALSTYSLDEVFTFFCAEETRQQISFTGESMPFLPPVYSWPSPWPKRSVTYHYCGKLDHLKDDRSSVDFHTSIPWCFFIGSTSSSHASLFPGHSVQASPALLSPADQ